MRSLFFVAAVLWLAAPIAMPEEAARPLDSAVALNLRLLNHAGAPEAARRLYEAACRVLAAKRDASFPVVAADPVVQRLAKENGIVHLGGPMLGAIRADGASVWLRTLAPAKVEVRIAVDGAERAFGPVESTPETDLTAVVPITGLKPETRYPYRVLVDGKEIPVPPHAAIATAPDSAKPSKVRIAFGTCPHRAGLSNKKLAEAILNRRPTAMLLYGDIAVQDRRTSFGLQRADYLLRDFFPAWQALAAAVPVYAVWDDHDYFGDDQSGLPPGCTREEQQGIWEVFRRAWNNPSYGFGDERRGVFLRTRIGPCDVIMTDARYFRDHAARGKENSFLGADQMHWLETQLLDCKGPFIILANSTMWSDYVSGGKDSWGTWDTAGRERIFSLIEKHRIAGVLLISGDRHGARGFRIPRPSGFSFYEFEQATLGGRSGPPVTNREWTTQLYGIAGKNAFGEFTIDATLPDPEVTFRLIGEGGVVIHELKLTRGQLTPPGE